MSFWTRRKTMNKKDIDHDTVKKIVRFSYKEFRIKERTNITKGQAIEAIVQMIKKELKDNANSEN